MQSSVKLVVLGCIVSTIAPPYIADGVYVDGKLCDDSKLTATAAHGLGEIGIFSRVDVDNRAVGDNRFPPDDILPLMRRAIAKLERKYSHQQRDLLEH